MDTWRLSQTGYRPDDTVENGNRFLIGNGYMGVRGTVDEWGRREFAAVNLAGVYDRYAGKWREPVNAPNGLYLKLFMDGNAMALGETEPLSHTISIDYRHGVFSRDTRFSGVQIQSERFASMAEAHLLVSRVTLTFFSDARAELLTGISTDIWDINGPHLTGFTYHTGDVLTASACTGELSIPVCTAQMAQLNFPCEQTYETGGKGAFRHIRFPAKAGAVYTITLFAAVYTGLDGGGAQARAAALCDKASRDGFTACQQAHFAAWDGVWERSEVDISGSDEAARNMHASQYHLNSIAPRHADALSIPARGLSGQTYKGAVFWDSEIFLFPVFAHTEPKLAETLLRYRIETLPGARCKAAEYGFRGAFYAWESQEGGAEGCTDYNVTDVFTHRPVRTYFRDKQIHISADVAYALWRYFEITGKRDILRDGGAEVIMECARFYLSYAYRRLGSDRVELLDVIGPDEYHERVNNNAYTNRMAAHCMMCALAIRDIFDDEPTFVNELTQRLGYEDDWRLLKQAAPALNPDFQNDTVIEQFDGYFGLEDCPLDTVKSRVLDPREYWGTNRGVAAHTQIIKQADVIAMTALFPDQFSDETVERNWRYYEPRTEHGSSLSACMYALTACRFGRPDLAWELFIKTASIDVSGQSKQWAGEIYIGGTHPAANGGAWMIAVLGFAGLSVKNGEMTLTPHLPEQIRTLRFRVTSGGKRMLVTVTHDGWDAVPVER